MSKEAEALAEVKKEFAELKKEFKFVFDEHIWRQSMYEANFKLLKENEELKVKLAKYGEK